MRIYDQKKTSAKIVQKSDLGGSWAPFGKGLGRSGASWGHFWAHFDCLLDVPNHIFLKQWAKMGSKRLFGWLLDRFWEGLGRIWMRLGRIWAFKIRRAACSARRVRAHCLVKVGNTAFREATFAQIRVETSASWVHVGTMLALFSLLSASWVHFSRLAAFVVPFGRFFRDLGRSSLDF